MGPLAVASLSHQGKEGSGTGFELGREVGAVTEQTEQTPARPAVGSAAVPLGQALAAASTLSPKQHTWPLGVTSCRIKREP